MIFRFDIKTVSEANAREHWSARLARKKKQQRDFTILWKSFKPRIELPATVIFTRYSCKQLDTDNNVGAFKHIRDALAKEIGIDDGSFAVDWQYRQQQIKKREHYFTVEIENHAVLENEFLR